MKLPSCDTEACRPLRADAVRNRQLILDTAAEVFAEQGLDAGYDEIARRAGIGVGTVYRRFPRREELLEALFESRIQEVVDTAETALSRPDAWDALAWFLERSVERQVVDRGLKEILVRSVSQDQHLTIGRERLVPLICRLVERAQAEGSLRTDVRATDLGVQLMLLSSMSTPAQPELWRRYLALLLDGLRARPDLPTLPLEAPADDAMNDLMCAVRGRPV